MKKERILKLVEDGVLSAKKAITLLEKLEEGQSVSLEKSTADHTFHEEKKKKQRAKETAPKILVQSCLAG
ncbi:hypothetical protein BsIDN1_61510 [Bacillus safensis]|uniref:YvlB/LiaX N-terminal domain-containing protein n=1 Tax=Bacillus safensis TaxID=561879 RepID=A0A5S9MHF7_BACIA|nr:hypothetical protein BsIDN1_61510 [Bacillus safensis]